MEKELVSLAMQINTTFGWMRKAKLPFQLNICNYTPGSRVDLELKKSFPTEQTWKVRALLVFLVHSMQEQGLNVHHGPVESVFPRERLIYLSPDATEVLQKVEQGKVRHTRTVLHFGDTYGEPPSFAFASGIRFGWSRRWNSH